MELSYQTGFGNQFSTEAIKGALPLKQNSPQQVPFDLYAEQLSGSAFTVPRANNLRSWLYRCQPSVVQDDFMPYEHSHLLAPPFANPPVPNMLRFGARPIAKHPHHFIDGWFTQAGHGSPMQQTGAAIHLYTCNQDMQDDFFCNADGELLIVPQLGGLFCRTEMGNLTVHPGEIMVMPRGIKFQINLLDNEARGYIAENFGAPLHIPDLGPIGANGLANPRDFHYPVAAFTERASSCRLLQKFAGRLWQAELDHEPLDVVAWHGNYAPYKYHLEHFNTMNTVSFDHPDPSIFTVLTSSSATTGVANLDFVIFPSRWMVAEHTFRPPYFHRNIMSEYMGLIRGSYDAKPGGFVPGGSSFHNCMSPHGPDVNAYQKGIKHDLQPEKYPDTMAFMFESQYIWQLSQQALDCPSRDHDYIQAWLGLAKQFKG